MINKSTPNASGTPARCETRVDHCGQSLFEVWLPVDALERYDAWFDRAVAELEQQFAEFITDSSDKGRRRR